MDCTDGQWRTMDRYVILMHGQIGENTIAITINNKCYIYHEFNFS